jgi:hypothetical protein
MGESDLTSYISGRVVLLMKQNERLKADVKTAREDADMHALAKDVALQRITQLLIAIGTHKDNQEAEFKEGDWFDLLLWEALEKGNG